MLEDKNGKFIIWKNRERIDKHFDGGTQKNGELLSMLNGAYKEVYISVRQGASEKFEMDKKGWLGVFYDFHLAFCYSRC